MPNVGSVLPQVTEQGTPRGSSSREWPAPSPGRVTPRPPSRTGHEARAAPDLHTDKHRTHSELSADGPSDLGVVVEHITFPGIKGPKRSKIRKQHNGHFLIQTAA